MLLYYLTTFTNQVRLHKQNIIAYPKIRKMRTYTKLMRLLKRGFTYPKEITISFLILLLTASSLYAQNQASVVFNPSNTSVLNGETFTVNVRVQIASGSVDFAQIHFNFDN